MSNVGRPTIMDEITLQKLEEAFSWGCTDREACLNADISERTLYNYQESNPEFVQRKEALKDNPIRLARKTVFDKMADDGKLAMDYLKHKKSDEFSTAQKIDQKMEIKGITLEEAMEMDVEELQKIIND